MYTNGTSHSTPNRQAWLALLARAHLLLAQQRRGNPQVPELTVEQIIEQLGLAVDRLPSCC